MVLPICCLVAKLWVCSPPPPPYTLQVRSILMASLLKLRPWEGTKWCGRSCSPASRKRTSSCTPTCPRRKVLPSTPKSPPNQAASPPNPPNLAAPRAPNPPSALPRRLENPSSAAPLRMMSENWCSDSDNSVSHTATACTTPQ